MRLVVAVFFVLVFPGTAAAATWSAPQRLSGLKTFIDPTVVFSGNGRALAAWQYQDGLRNSARRGDSEASRAPGAPAFGPSRALTKRTRVTRPAETVQGVAAYGRTGALVATSRPVGLTGTRLFVRFG